METTEILMRQTFRILIARELQEILELIIVPTNLRVDNLVDKIILEQIYFFACLFCFILLFLFFLFVFLCSFFFCFSCFYALNKTPLGETRCLSNPWFFYWLLNHLVFLIHPLSLTQSVWPHLVPYQSLYSTCVTYGKPCRSIGHQVPPIQLLPTEVKDFPRSGKYPQDVPLPTYLDYLQSKGNYWLSSICVLGPKNNYSFAFNILLNSSIFHQLLVLSTKLYKL